MTPFLDSDDTCVLVTIHESKRHENQNQCCLDHTKLVQVDTCVLLWGSELVLVVRDLCHVLQSIKNNAAKVEHTRS